MERVTIEQAKILLGNNFIGLDELRPLFTRMGGLYDGIEIPEIGYSWFELQQHSNDHILILGLSELDNIKLSIQTFRDCFGIDPNVSEPCFYNQDWYLKEKFLDNTLKNGWYLLKKTVLENSRACLLYTSPSPRDS